MVVVGLAVINDISQMTGYGKTRGLNRGFLLYRQSSKCSRSQMLLIFNTFDKPAVMKVSAAVSSVTFPLSSSVKFHNR